MIRTNPYEVGLDRQAVNHVPLSPVSFLARSAGVYPERVAVIHGARRYTWSQFNARACRLASALKAAGVGRGDTVAVIAANTPEMIEAHFGVPMVGAVLCTINTRLDAQAIAFILAHCEARMLITDTEYSATVADALARMDSRPRVIDIDDAEGPGGERLGESDYEAFIKIAIALAAVDVFSTPAVSSLGGCRTPVPTSSTRRAHADGHPPTLHKGCRFEQRP
jgi:fatty-acyl-CoA synthase